MGSLKRRMKRKQRKTDPDFYVSAWAENGNIIVIIRAGGWISGTGVSDTDLPDGHLPWLAQEIVTKIEQSSCSNQEEALCLADQVIQGQIPVFLVRYHSSNEIPVSKRQCKELGALH